jgi:magnesium transporter
MTIPGDIETTASPDIPALPADAAAAIAALRPDEGVAALRRLDVRQRALVFGYLKPKLQARLAGRMELDERAAMVEAMSHDERADLYKALSPKGQEALLGALARAEREDLRRLSAWSEGTVGAVMTSDYAFLWPEMTAPQALEALRRQAPESETVYTALVASRDYRLLGVVSLRKLMLASAAQTVAEIMTRDPVTVRADAAREEAARLIARYDLLVLPVVDGEGRMVGIVTQDDAMDVAEEEANEDALRGSSVGGIEGSVLDTSLQRLYTARIGWLVLLVLGSVFSGAGLAAFEATIAAHLRLLFFLPLLIGAGGNAGAQSATLTIRALATGDVRAEDYGRMVLREIAVAVALGATMAIAIAAVGLLRADARVVGVVALSMTLIVLIGSLLGLTLPFLLQRSGLDPATASGPLVASLCDVTGVLIYFGIAALLLPM